MQTTTMSIAEQRRLEKLASEVEPSRWIVAPADPDAEVLTIAGAASRAPLFAVVGPNPVSALARLQKAGLRHRAYLSSGGEAVLPPGWRGQIGLLCLPATHRNLKTLMASWGGHVAAGGHVLFYGGVVPRPELLGLRPAYWTSHVREGGGLFLLTRRPHG